MSGSLESLFLETFSAPREGVALLPPVSFEVFTAFQAAVLASAAFASARAIV